MKEISEVMSGFGSFHSISEFKFYILTPDF